MYILYSMSGSPPGPHNQVLDQMSILPPGVGFLARKLLIPSLVILLFNGVATHPSYGFGLPFWLAFLIAVSITIVVIVVNLLLVRVRDSWEAHAHGAQLAPNVTGLKLGNSDILRKLIAASENGYIGEAFSELMGSLGPVFNLRIFWSDKLFTTVPEHIQIILATDFRNYVKGPQFISTMDSVLGSGVFNSDGEMWSFHRSMTRPYFSRDRIQHFELFDAHTDRVITLIKRRMVEGHAIDFQDLISRLTMDSATAFLFGSSVDSLACTPPYPHNASPPFPLVMDSARARDANAFTAAYNEAMHQIAVRQRIGPSWPLFEMFKDKTVQPMKQVARYIDPLIQAAIERKNKTRKTKCHPDDTCLLDDLLDSTQDHKVLKDEILNVLIAGRDTTMSVLTNVVYFLSLHPEVMHRLREEILTFVGPSNRPTYDVIKQLKYLRAVINETMRLFPPVPHNIRQTVNSTVWPATQSDEKPLYIPAGTTILYSVLLMQRRPDLWGPDADLFDPDRFLDHRAKQYLSHPFRFLPFNAGPRICLGQQFAYNEMSFVIIRLLQNFSSMHLDVNACAPEDRPPSDWQGCPGRKGIEQFVPRSHLTLYSKGGLWVRMEPTDGCNLQL
ncbi:hypothetical protein MIND_00022500 [Mycena indigotica]|uniref:Cytochrome P450 n=1 Tax=Mycena indigotica TaxID=2126181 RepID=A0A8H6TCB9_9AGAR|nr:uncharacterized protein MIND_00022500 [Mycena indigotica]KAF7315083.1 hypothetical protein MIND_00022500 [Mycena indigotica]